MRQPRSSESGPTVLERELTGNGKNAATPVDAFRAARRRFLRSERVDMGDIAGELGISRATLYRWVGSRDQLLGEVMWSMNALGISQAREKAKGRGAEWVLNLYWELGELIVAFDPLRFFIENEPEAALRVMASKHSPNQERMIAAWADILEEAVRDKGLVLKLDADTLAYVLVRIAESFLWADLITGQQADRHKAQDVARALLT